MYAHLNFTDFNVGTCLRGGGRREWEEEQRRLEEEARRREEEEARRREVERVRLKEVRAGIFADSMACVALLCHMYMYMYARMSFVPCRAPMHTRF